MKILSRADLCLSVFSELTCTLVFFIAAFVTIFNAWADSFGPGLKEKKLVRFLQSLGFVQKNYTLQIQTSPRSGSQYKYSFNIGSIESFEQKLKDAQETLGIDPHDYVPVTYFSEMVWYQELLRFASTLLLIQGRQ